MSLVRLKCVKEGSKLRMKILTPGYRPGANCQCSYSIRTEGREYTIISTAITIVKTHNKYFYRLKNHLINPVEEDQVDVKDVYNSGDTDCSICMDQEKDTVFAPCGHYCCCMICAVRIKFGDDSRKCVCPLCRVFITAIIDIKDIK